MLGLATGQSLNLSFAIIGLGLMLWATYRRPEPAGLAVSDEVPPAGLLWRRLVFGAILLFSLTLPSDWTQDVPARYGKRHPGLRYSAIYTPSGARPPAAIHRFHEASVWRAHCVGPASAVANVTVTTTSPDSPTVTGSCLVPRDSCQTSRM